MNKEIRQFNIRVYGILKNTKGQILLSDEYVLDRYMTKFPGGGLKFGEGPEDCIKREAIEEFGQEIEIIQHFYTTGFFQKALFYDDHQLISIYYSVKLKQEPGFKISTKPFDFNEKINGSQSFRWVHPDAQDESELSFPIDRYVLRLLKSK
ncbi:MAG: NUDIX domain-containing protein [Bacteroidales bacterium]|nr:NUDIX domain-containing protein [Bacteroidales bacterium]